MADLTKTEPMSFSGFLRATGDEELALSMDSIDSVSGLDRNLSSALSEKLKTFFVAGGIPEVVDEYRETRDFNAVDVALQNVISKYEASFAAAAKRSAGARKYSQIIASIPFQLDCDNKKYLYKTVREGARAREYSGAISRLVESGIIVKISRTSSPKVPLDSNDDSVFKIYLSDVGLLRFLSQIPPAESPRLFTMNYGALSENFICQSICRSFATTPRYWTYDTPPYIVDFLVEKDGRIFPIAVETAGPKSRSLDKYCRMLPTPPELCIRFTTEGIISLKDSNLTLPLFLAEHTARFIDIALASK